MSFTGHRGPPGPPGPDSPEAARQAGCTFYDLPSDLEGVGVDPLILPICQAINESGYCYTAESCAGHPEAAEPVWVDNVEPMLRLVYKPEHEGRVFAALMGACRSMEVPPVMPTDTEEEILAKEAAMTAWGRPQAAALKVYPNMRGQPAWCETLIYVYASTVWSRNRGLETLRRFAERLKETA